MSTITLKIGESKTVQLQSETQTANGTGVGPVLAEVAWESDNSDVATVVTGLTMADGASSSAAVITGVWLGTTTVTATTTDGKEDVITVNVVSASNEAVRIGVA